MKKHFPTRKLREHPDLDQLRRQAKELLADSWPKLKAYVEGVNVRRLTDAVRAGDLAQVRALLKVRPELARMGIDNYSVVHFAVLNRSPEMVRVLMERGANAHEGVYPHRDATSALTIAIERRYDDIVAVIQETEQRRRQADQQELPDEAVRRGWTPLHLAAVRLNADAVESELARGADANRRDKHDRTPLDLAAGQWWGENIAERFAAVAKLLLARGAQMTARAAAALGDVDWLRARHAEVALVNDIEDSGGLLRIAASHNLPDVLALLLDLGFDPDERMRFDDDEGAFTWGMPLHHCAGSAKYEMAEMLLKRGADPNAAVSASGDPMFQAYSQQDWKMIALLEQYGGIVNATSAGLYRQTELARKMLAGEAKHRLDGVGGDTLAEQLLWGSTCGGDPEIVRMALERVDWPRDDPRWFTVLEQPLRIWTHGSGSETWDRSTYLTCFRLVVERCDPNLRGRPQDNGQFGLTILHSIAGSREHVTSDERVAFATIALDAGARLDIRDNLLKSTPLGWACRWRRVELVKLFLERGADLIEADAEPWATPRAWATKMGHHEVLSLL